MFHCARRGAAHKYIMSDTVWSMCADASIKNFPFVFMLNPEEKCCIMDVIFMTAHVSNTFVDS